MRDKTELYINAWWNRTLDCIDLDNDGVKIPRWSKGRWKMWVRKELKKLLKGD